ncbi:MAG: DUF3047 domain-containing protein [Deltaproteobacteria bacterium]|nr:MAG: DUF3047 domain-containing protein [Deltaproteobacteria bacterium]TMB34469.1 MAG: DUF3047 domain-containing protein [Deltaproteobacteria bacterium]TMB38960.1 MAG: DUF3047 domain-containing protein [Deltaproteobacteria bacterium]
MRPLVAIALALSTLGGPARALGPVPPTLRAIPIDLHAFKVLERDSGPRNYYRTMSEVEEQEFIRGVYSPSLQTVTLFAPVPDELRRGARSLRFRWRALVLPRGGNECKSGRGDGAANVYITWKRGLRWYSVKLVWSTDAPAGATCNGTRNAFVASDSVIVRSGGPTGVWEEVEVDPDTLYRVHFEGGRADAEVPELQGIGILTDGDQTHNVSAADYAGFVFYKDRQRTASLR